MGLGMDLAIDHRVEHDLGNALGYRPLGNEFSDQLCLLGLGLACQGISELFIQC